MFEKAKGDQPAVLTSWKEIASYVGKGVRTVQRWEKQDRLPVRRIMGTSKIVAYREDLERWLRAQPLNHGQAGEGTAVRKPSELRGNLERFDQLQKECRELRRELRGEMQKLIEECLRASDNCKNTFERN